MGKFGDRWTKIGGSVDDTVKERIVLSDTALQSSSSNHISKNLAKSKCHDPCTSSAQECKNASSSQKATTEMTSYLKNKPVGPRVVVYPEHVTYGGNCYHVAELLFFCTFVRINDLEKARDLILECETVDIISIESRWSEDILETANIRLRIKSEHPKVVTSGQNSGILEVEFSVCDPDWVSTQDKIKSLDARYNEKWDVDLDSYESFEDETYLDGECDSISISKKDFQLLQPEKFINDTIVDFYVEHLKKIKPADARVHFFNSFFFRKLADFDENRPQSIDTKGAFQRVRKWTKKLNIFQMDYIFIPVNFSSHWSLIVICHPGEVVNFTDDEPETSLKVPCILHLNSIKGSHSGLENCIKWYLWGDWKERNNNAADDIFKKFMDLLFLCVEVPQQQNSFDCALFMLHYMELFVKQAPIYFGTLNNFINKDWFDPIEASLKRARIKRMIFELAKTNVQHGSSPGCSDNSSYELKDEDDDEADVEIRKDNRSKLVVSKRRLPVVSSAPKRYKAWF